MLSQGYVRFPHLHGTCLVFVSEDDLWLLEVEGGRAERLTAGVGEVSSPRFSPDGKYLAFVGREEGPSEVYVMPASGGSARRLTFEGGDCRVVGWTPNGEEILYATNAGQFHPRFTVICAIKPTGGQPRVLPYGMANTIAFGPRGGVVIGRTSLGRDYSHWKRYRGGTAGHVWCDANGSGIFRRLLHLTGNMADVCWIADRIYFLSDHHGVGNIYSCTPEGQDLHQHTDHQDFYARHLASDGQRLVYHCGADLYVYDPATGSDRRLLVTLPSLRTQRNRKFVPTSSYLDTYALHPQGYAVALTTRGKAFTMGNWEGPVLQHGQRDGVRYRKLEWLNDGKRLVAVTDATGREALVVFTPQEERLPHLYADLEFGRVVRMEISPTDDLVAITNHRNELVVVDLEAGTARVLDRNAYRRIHGVTWSPDGRWLAYGFARSAQQTAMKLCNVESGETHVVTEPVLHDISPSFDPEGKYLYFLGYRTFLPAGDNIQFDLSFPRGVKPYAIMLSREQRSPFLPELNVPDERGKEKEQEEFLASNRHNDSNEAKDSEAASEKEDAQEKGRSTPTRQPLVIDLEGITERAVPFPVAEGRFHRVQGLKGKALFLVFPSEAALPHENEVFHESTGSIDCYTFQTYKNERIVDGVNGFAVSRDSSTLICCSNQRLRVVKAGEKPSLDQEHPSRETGWLDLGRVKVSVQPGPEWKQMFAEAWRLQHEQFWNEEMSGIDWRAIYDRYAPLVERISSRSELSDLLWELQGELGTSHAFEQGGEYRQGPQYQQGFLGVDWKYDGESERYRIARIVKGDTSDSAATSPLTSPGLHIAEGDACLSINGQRIGKEYHPQELLVNQAESPVQLTIESAATAQTRVITVRALADERPARYREWVEKNRRLVYLASCGKVGYIHIPNMLADGYAEFHRGFLAEYDRPALLVDVRWNSGGNVSGLLLSKLARRRLGYAFSRWDQPVPYPPESPHGPMVALTNEHAGSDGDIFSHCFKLMGLGPLIGKRTWGGVIGVNPRHRLVDGTLTTQPEFSFWFKDVGWKVENYGTEPDIEVDIAPQDYASNADPQLDRAIAEALRLLEEYPTLEPNPGER